VKALFALGLLVFLPAALANDLRLEGITAYGCSIDQQKDGSWRTTVWAEHDSKRDWQLLYSVRRTAAKGMKDCET
jgi:hypothetical protein